MVNTKILVYIFDSLFWAEDILDRDLDQYRSRYRSIELIESVKGSDSLIFHSDPLGFNTEPDSNTMSATLVLVVKMFDLSVTSIRV